MADSIFLSVEEVRQLTGCRTRPAQVRWLRDEGFRFRVDRLGNPIVLREHLVAEMGGSSGRTTRTLPNLDALRIVKNGTA